MERIKSGRRPSAATLKVVGFVTIDGVITFRVSRRRREMYCGHARLCVCLSVCVGVSVRGRMPTLLHEPGCNLEW